MSNLDPHEKAPEQLKFLYKRYQRLKDLDTDPDIVDPRGNTTSNGLRCIRTIDTSKLTFSHPLYKDPIEAVSRKVDVLEHHRLPGFHIVPSLFPEHLQKELLSRLLHRELVDQQHHTNLHKFYDIPYDMALPTNTKVTLDKITAKSFFYASPSSLETFTPLDPSIHKPLTIQQVLQKKLRWITLGVQYDWTNKTYPDALPPAFAQDIATVIQQAFPEMTPEAAIVNVYSPGDKLSLHRDVSEVSDEGLVSVSIGCEAIFVVGLQDKDDAECTGIAIRLRSGDAIYMSKKSRYAWHGVSSILAGTCPEEVGEWPAVVASEVDESQKFQDWAGWMHSKRINLNIRQMNP